TTTARRGFPGRTPASASSSGSPGDAARSRRCATRLTRRPRRRRRSGYAPGPSSHRPSGPGGAPCSVEVAAPNPTLHPTRGGMSGLVCCSSLVRRGRVNWSFGEGGAAVADTHEDPVFGRLTWDGLLNCWLGGVDLRADFHVEITVSGTDEDRFMGFSAAKE